MYRLVCIAAIGPALLITFGCGTVEDAQDETDAAGLRADGGAQGSNDAGEAGGDIADAASTVDATWQDSGGAAKCNDGWTGQDCQTCTVFVDAETGDDTSGGRSWDDSLATVNAGIDLAVARQSVDSVDACSVWVEAGTYVPGTSRSDAFVLQPGVHLYGGFSGVESSLGERDWRQNVTTLSGDLGQEHAFHVVVGANNAILDGFDVIDGVADGEASENRRGGGMVNIDASPVVANVSFRNNFARNVGGAMLNAGESAPTISRSTFESNSMSATLASTGGGIANLDSSNPMLVNVVFTENTANGSGGAMLNTDESAPMVINAVFVNNSATSTTDGLGRGGAVRNAGNSAATFFNVSFSGNVANGGGFGGGGGGMHNDNTAIVEVRNGIFFGNEASPQPEIGLDNTVAESETTVSHSIVEGGLPDQVSDGGGNLDADPGFVSSSDLQLTTGSPAIDSGDGSVTGEPDFPNVDINGNTRVSGSGIDMGAHEFQE